MKRGKIRITADLLAQLIFHKPVADLNIIKNEEFNCFDIYFTDDALDDVDEGTEVPQYVLEEYKEQLGLRRVG